MTMTNDANTTLDELRAAVRRFNDAREWHQFHTPKNVVASIAIEAAELLEHFQWTEQTTPEQLPQVAQELADVFIYCLVLADALDIDLSKVVRQKLAHNDAKYPADQYRGRF
jgi:dCTP diphosphatase